MRKNRYWTITITGIAVFLIILLAYTGGNSISNLYFIPAGTCNPFQETNVSPDQVTAGNTVLRGDDPGKEQKKIDSHFDVDEWNLSSQERSSRKISVLDVTDKDLREFPGLERSLQKTVEKPNPVDMGLRPVASFEGNVSDYVRFISSVCQNKPRSECYGDVPVFNYHGRNYSISWFVYDTTRPLE